MPAVTSFTAPRMQEIVDGTIVSLEVVGGDLIATYVGGGTGNLGSVLGPEGPVGPAGYTSIEVCTSTTRPGAPFDGLHIYETDTGETLVWNAPFWHPVNCEGKPHHELITPSTALLTTAASLSPWSPDVSIDVPDWAQRILCTTTVSGMYAVGGFMGIGLAFVVSGSEIGEEVVFNFDNPTTRQSITWTDEIDVDDFAGTTDQIEVYARRIVGAGTLRADTQSNFRFTYQFTAYP